MRTDWMPTSRTGQLSMAKKWDSYLTEQRVKEWSVSVDLRKEFFKALTDADKTFSIATTNDRTAAMNTAVRVSFGKLVDIMRDLRRHPQKPEELTASHFTRRKRDLIDFPYDNSGKQCFICVRYENSKGDKGPWGPMVNSFIP